MSQSQTNQHITEKQHQDALLIARELRRELRQDFPWLHGRVHRTWTDRRVKGVRSKMGLHHMRQVYPTDSAIYNLQVDIAEWGKTRDVHAAAGWQIMTRLKRERGHWFYLSIVVKAID